MKIKKAEVMIEKSSEGGYGIYIPSIPGIGVIGDTEEEAKMNLREVISDMADQCKKDGVRDRVNGGNLDISYQYDPSVFLKAFGNFNVSHLEYEEITQFSNFDTLFVSSSSIGSKNKLK
jgi:hypothetical protein